MKSILKTYLFLFLLFCFASSFGQAITVNTSGQVGIKGNPYSSYDLTVNGKLKVTSFISTPLLYVPTLNPDANTLNVGSNHVGISTSYYTNSTLKVASEGQYAIYIEGNAWATGSWMSASDKKLKKDIEDLNKKSMLGKVLQLQAKSYYFKDSTELEELHNQGLVRFSYDTSITIDRITGEEKEEVHLNIPHFPKTKQFGLLADDVEMILPELVTRDTVSNIKGLSYTNLIPILIEAIKEQQSQIDELTYKIFENSKESSLKSLQTSSIDTYMGEKNVYPMLYQNNPNPFNESTVIRYQLPENTNSGKIFIYDMTGKQLRKIPLTEDGESSINISAGELSPGMYMYSMIVENQLIDTKQMVITE